MLHQHLAFSGDKIRGAGMERIIARYKVKRDKAQEHEMLVDEVFRELGSKLPGGVRCLVLKLNDGSYIHVAFIENRTRLSHALESFGLFQITIAERCTEPPLQGDLTIFRDYGVLEIDR